MFFSIIMPAYNSGKTIRKSINSILNQTYQDFELIIINDSSTDETEDILKSFCDNGKIIIVNNVKNIGVAESRNKGIHLATGDIITFLDSDDIWQQDKLYEQIKCFNKGEKIVCSCFNVIDENDNLIGVRNPREIITYNDMLKSNHIGNLTGAYLVSFFGKHYQKKFGHEDYIMWLELMSSGTVAYCIQKNLASYRISNSSLSANKLKAIRWQWHIYKKVLNFPLLKASYYFICYMINALKKRN